MGSAGGGGPTTAGDINGNPISLESWLKTHRPEGRELVQGLKGEATYIITAASGDKIKDFGINAVCTHLGCVVPWVQAANRFICPCHGSQYNDEGKKVRGPAPCRWRSPTPRLLMGTLLWRHGRSRTSAQVRCRGGSEAALG